MADKQMPPKDPKGPTNLFTQRELQCLRQLMEGKGVSEISESMSIAKRSVCFYLTGVRNKIGLLIRK